MQIFTLKLKTLGLFAFVAFSFHQTFAQIPSQPDTTVIFTPSKNLFQAKSESHRRTNGWGLDLLVSDNGFGMGGFYRNEINKDLSWGISLLISSAKDPSEVEQYDYYGNSYVLGKKNRVIMIPFHVSVQYRLFREKITDSFRPFLTAGAGPTMLYVFPYADNYSVIDPWTGLPAIYTEKKDFFSSLKYGRTHYTLGGFIGAGAYFGLGNNTLAGLSVRYYLAHFPEGIEVMEWKKTKDFGGIALLLQFGTMQ